MLSKFLVTIKTQKTPFNEKEEVKTLEMLFRATYTPRMLGVAECMIRCDDPKVIIRTTACTIPEMMAELMAFLTDEYPDMVDVHIESEEEDPFGFVGDPIKFGKPDEDYSETKEEPVKSAIKSVNPDKSDEWF